MKTAPKKETAILNCLFGRGPATRAQLADALALRRNTVGDLCAGLIASGALQELDSDKQRNVRLSLCPDLMFADMAIVDPTAGRSLRSAHIPGWNNIPTCEILAGVTGLKTWLAGFTDAAAVMELRAIPDPAWGTALCLWLNQAIGLSVFLNGETVRGNHPVFGEIGHVVVEPNGGICRCGNRGCLETVASIGAILQRVSEGMERGAEFRTVGEDITIDDVIANANDGNKLALRVLGDSGRAVGRALAMAVNMFGISNILLMGRLAEAGDVFLGPVKEAVRRDCVAPINADVQYRVVGRPSAGVAAGAAYLAFHGYFLDRIEKA